MSYARAIELRDMIEEVKAWCSESLPSGVSVSFRCASNCDAPKGMPASLSSAVGKVIEANVSALIDQAIEGIEEEMRKELAQSEAELISALDMIRSMRETH